MAPLRISRPHDTKTTVKNVDTLYELLQSICLADFKMLHFRNHPPLIYLRNEITILTFKNRDWPNHKADIYKIEHDPHLMIRRYSTTRFNVSNCIPTHILPDKSVLKHTHQLLAHNKSNAKLIHCGWFASTRTQYTIKTISKTKWITRGKCDYLTHLMRLSWSIVKTISNKPTSSFILIPIIQPASTKLFLNTFDTTFTTLTYSTSWRYCS